VPPVLRSALRIRPMVVPASCLSCLDYLGRPCHRPAMPLTRRLTRRLVLAQIIGTAWFHWRDTEKHHRKVTNS
jgi:hypothetical protein